MSAAGAAGDALEIELVGSENTALEAAARTTLARLSVTRGHVAIEIVDQARISELNRDHRGKPGPTDVLSFPVDGEEIASTPDFAPATGDTRPSPGDAPIPPANDQRAAPPFELGDVVICPEHTTDIVEATVHGVLHLCGFDHETDDGRMLALQDEIMATIATAPPENRQ